MQLNTSAFVLAFILASSTASSVPSVAPGPGDQEGIVLRLLDDRGHAATAVVEVGGVVTYTRRGLPPLRLSPDYAGTGNIRLAISLDDVVAPAHDAVASELSGAVPLGGSTHINLGEYAIDVQWVGVVDLGGYASDESDPDNAAECCVECDGIRTCGCRVEASCGMCCTAACGGCTGSAPEEVAGPNRVRMVASGSRAKPR